MMRTARCGCGQVQIACQGEPRKVSLCHCLDCQRRTGGPFGVAVFYDASATTITGESVAYARDADSGFPITFHFCGTCGSTVFWYPSRKPELVAVAIGAFADPDFPAPSQEVYAQHRHAWVTPLA